MDNVKDHLAQLLNKSSWSLEEKKWFLSYIENTSGSELEELLTQQFGDVDASGPPDEETARIVLERMRERIGVKRRPVVRLRRWHMVVAASLVGLIIIAAYYLATRVNKKEVVQNGAPAGNYKNDVPPGTNKAILILADGSKVVLDDTQNGLVTSQGSSKIIKFGSKLSYRDSSSGVAKIVYNTITTPRAAQYQIELPDGSMAWLNAASSLRFPTAFTGSERRVEVTGEVYFEIAKSKSMPFVVAASGAVVQVLGTHFNVMAYNDEDALKTTLLEGKVKVVQRDPGHYREANGKPVNTQYAILKPGEQASLSNTSQSSHAITVQTVNVNRVTAWKNGLFDFENAGIETVMRQLSRWYDVDVIFRSHNNKDLFMLEMPRSSKLSDILKILELTGNIKFEIDGKKVIVFA